MIASDTLIYDIETKTFGKPNPEKDIMRVFGCYSYKYKKKFCLTKPEQIQKMINEHKYIVGFNNHYYDDPIIKRAKIKLDYKINIDLKAIISKRKASMMTVKGLLSDLLMEENLDFITRLLGLVTKEEGKIKDFDYSILCKDTWTKEEVAYIKHYTERDIEITCKLYEWIEDHFEGLKDFISEEDVRKKAYLTTTIAAYAYKAICYAMSWSEDYDDSDFEDEESIKGGYVAYPAGEEFKGDIFCLDFNSLYPHVIAQCNLYGYAGNTLSNRPSWNGGGIWKVEGKYFADKMHPVGQLIMKWYKERQKLKANKDPKEYGIKNIIVTIYGLMNNTKFVKISNKIGGGDCTRLGRQWTKYSRKVFKQEGYINLYSDTDSAYLLDVYNDKARILAVKDKIIKYIKDSVPFSQDTFDMGIDDEIQFMAFYKGRNIEDKASDSEMDEDDFINKPKGLMKKNYLYVTKGGKVKIKNLGVRKKSNSYLSRKIFWDYLVPKIIEEKKGKFSKTYIKNLITILLEKDYTLAKVRFSADNISAYKKSPNGIYAQISEKYGAGIHFLIPNTKGIGIGKGKKYCTLEEYKEHNLRISDIDLTKVWRELGYFIKPIITKNIFEF